AHRRAHPKRWTKWRRTGQGFEILDGAKWTKLRPKVMRALPRDFRIAGTYSRTGGGGNVAYGGSVAIITWGSYKLDRSGRFSTESGGGSSAPNVTTKSANGPA